MNENFVSRQQLSLLPERIWKAEETDATHELYRYLWDKFEKKAFKPMRIMIVGAGGSYPAALAAAHSIRDEMRTPNVEVATPQTAIQTIKQFSKILNCDWHPEYDVVIGISYSGKTPDIKAVSEVCTSRGYAFVLLTGADKEELKELYHEYEFLKIISYFNAKDTSSKERGMISMFSTLMPAIIFDDYILSSARPAEHYFEVYREDLENGEKFVSDLNITDMANSINKAPIIHVFYEWATLPTAADIESKFVESGIANVVLHEKKNFSHGRYTALFKQDFALAINLTYYAVGTSMETSEVHMLYKHDYDSQIAKFLKGICENKSAHYIEMGNGLIEPAQWNIKEMSKLPYLITAIGEALNIDISKPLTPFPKEAITLYDYKGEF